MKALVRITPSSYEIGDIVAIVDDAHVFGGRDIVVGEREVVNLGNLTDAEIEKLTMQDVTPKSRVIGLIPAFRSKATGIVGTKQLHRRKYYFDNGVKLKSNAQERI